MTRRFYVGAGATSPSGPAGGSGEESRRSARVEEDHGFVPTKALGFAQEAGKRLRGVDGVQQNAFGPGQALQRDTSGLGRTTVGFTHVGPLDEGDVARSESERLAEALAHLAREACHGGREVLPQIADVDAEGAQARPDELQAGQEAGERPSRAGSDDQPGLAGSEPPRLVVDLQSRTHVAERARPGVSADRDEVVRSDA